MRIDSLIPGGGIDSLVGKVYDVLDATIVSLCDGLWLGPSYLVVTEVLGMASFRDPSSSHCTLRMLLEILTVGDEESQSPLLKDSATLFG